MNKNRPNLFGLGVFGITVMAVIGALASIGVSVAIIFALIEAIQWLARH